MSGKSELCSAYKSGYLLKHIVFRMYSLPIKKYMLMYIYYSQSAP